MPQCWESGAFSHKSYNTTLGEAEGKCKHSEMETIIINTKLIGTLPECAHWHSSWMNRGRVAFEMTIKLKEFDDNFKQMMACAS